MGLLLLLLQLVLHKVVALSHLLGYEADGSQTVCIANKSDERKTKSQYIWFDILSTMENVV